MFLKNGFLNVEHIYKLGSIVNCGLASFCLRLKWNFTLLISKHCCMLCKGEDFYVMLKPIDVVLDLCSSCFVTVLFFILDFKFF